MSHGTGARNSRFAVELEKARKTVLEIPSTVFLRSSDALHLACAEEHGFNEVYTNDRQMLQAAKHFHVTGGTSSPKAVEAFHETETVGGC